MASSTLITLASSDGLTFTVERKTVERSILIKDLLCGLGVPKEAIPIMAVDGSVLEKVIEWCDHHINDPPIPDNDDSAYEPGEIAEWDLKFMLANQKMLIEIINAANYLNIKALIGIGCRIVAETLENKLTKEIRKICNIVSDFAPGEEEEIRKKNEWANYA